MDDVAAALTSATGRPVRYEQESVEQAYASRAHYGAAPFELEAWVSTYLAIAAGEMSQVTDAVAQLTGHQATSFADYLSDPATWRHLL